MNYYFGIAIAVVVTSVFWMICLLRVRRIWDDYAMSWRERYINKQNELIDAIGEIIQLQGDKRELARQLQKQITWDKTLPEYFGKVIMVEGRGEIIVVNIEKGESVPKVNSQAFVNGSRRTIIGVESSQTLTGRRQQVGLILKGRLYGTT